MNLEIKIKDRLTKVELIDRKNNTYHINVDGRKYEVDAVDVTDGVYSLIHQNKSYNVELIQANTSKKYTVNSLYHSYDLEIVDAETRYLENRKSQSGLDEGNIISSPMSGRVVKINVKVDDEITEGQTLIVISAMKMESEYKTSRNGIVKKVHVSEGDIINPGQALITIE
jgi:biotin carboxyl carrier protein